MKIKMVSAEYINPYLSSGFLHPCPSPFPILGVSGVLFFFFFFSKKIPVNSVASGSALFAKVPKMGC